ncbi:MAG: tetratricopeptide repeat protein [Desulfosalsimonas sp.]
MKVRMLFCVMFLTAAMFAGHLSLHHAALSASEKDVEEEDIEELEEEILAKAEKLKQEADALFEKGGIEELEEMIGIYEELLKDYPDSFESNWKIARGCRFYADLAKRMEVEGWEEICEKYGKKGMEYARKSIELEPERPEGYYYYGLCAGSYSDGVGLFTALKEGLKNKAKDNLEKAYEIDKNFADGGPIIALGRFWQVVPWPYTDKDKAMEYYREYQETEFFEKPGSVNARVWMAEILIDRGGSQAEEEARKLLQKAIEFTDDPYWEKEADRLLEEI